MTEQWAVMNILSGCITVASAAIADAGIDCIDLATGGVAAVVSRVAGPSQLVLDPCPSDHDCFHSACVVAYLQSRDELTEVWAKGNGESFRAEDQIGMGFEALVDNAAEAASAARLVLVEALKESTEAKLKAILPLENPTSR